MGKRQPRPGPSEEQLETERRVLQLRAAAVPFARIAEEVGYGHASTALRAYQRALARVHHPEVEELRKLEGERLDTLQRAQWAKALAGDIKAADFILRVMKQRATLFGLNHSDQMAARQAAVSETQTAAVLALMANVMGSADLGEDEARRLKLAVLEELNKIGDPAGPAAGDDLVIEGEVVDGE